MSDSGLDRDRRRERLAEEAAGLEAAGRAAFLDRACPDDPELRLEIEQLLSTPGGLRPVTPPAWSEGEVPFPRPAIAAVVGQRVGNYQVVGKIGEGGMGAVYLARHQFFPRNAALKVLHAHLGGDPTLVRRFMNEARAANAIRHPNIIEVVDTGFLPSSGAPYLLMEYLEGENLGTRLRREGGLPVESALQIAGQIASALAAAHDQGIIHRDLKPENVFLLPRTGSGDLVKVLDFGIAKLRIDLLADAVETRPGMVVGTPRYMSPEQCLGPGPIDQRSDIYSLGVLIYEMICGVVPFDGSAMGELLNQHLTMQPAPMRSRVPAVPEFLDAAVLRALAKEPGDRFASMRELRAALGSAAVPRFTPATGQVAAGEQGQLLAASLDVGNWPRQGATPGIGAPSPVPSPGPAAGRRRAMVVVAGLAVLAVAVPVVVMGRQRQRAPVVPDAVVAPAPVQAGALPPAPPSVPAARLESIPGDPPRASPRHAPASLVRKKSISRRRAAAPPAPPDSPPAERAASRPFQPPLW